MLIRSSSVTNRSCSAKPFVAGRMNIPLSLYIFIAMCWAAMLMVIICFCIHTSARTYVCFERQQWTVFIHMCDTYGSRKGSDLNGHGSTNSAAFFNDVFYLLIYRLWRTVGTRCAYCTDRHMLFSFCLSSGSMEELR